MSESTDKSSQHKQIFGALKDRYPRDTVSYVLRELTRDKITVLFVSDAQLLLSGADRRWLTDEVERNTKLLDALWKYSGGHPQLLSRKMLDLDIPFDEEPPRQTILTWGWAE